MVLIRGGSFTMGSDEGGGDEQPTHQVTVDSFYMDKYEVTQEAYERVMGQNPSKRKGNDLPVERVRWDDAAKFCNKRSALDGLDPCYSSDEDEEVWECSFEASGYRLPTEAEWEYACRAGTSTAYYFGGSEQALTKHGWYSGNSRERTHPVGRKSPNPWGLYDMHGNVWEWVNDFYDRSYYGQSPARNPAGPKEGWRLMRGGSFQDSADSCRSSYRKYNEDEEQAVVCAAYEHLGFRCVRAAKKGE